MNKERHVHEVEGLEGRVLVDGEREFDCSSPSFLPHTLQMMLGAAYSCRLQAAERQRRGVLSLPLSWRPLRRAQREFPRAGADPLYACHGSAGAARARCAAAFGARIRDRGNGGSMRWHASNVSGCEPLPRSCHAPLSACGRDHAPALRRHAV
jgi:hypothetical protein